MSKEFEDISPKNICKWLKSTCKDVPHHYVLEKCKSKQPQNFFILTRMAKKKKNSTKCW